MGMLAIFGLLILAVLANVLGSPGLGLLGSREASFAVTLLFFAAMLSVSGWTVCSRWDGVFIDRDNRISLARFQLILWTILIVSALFTGGLTNMTGNIDPPLKIYVPPAIWALLGLGSFSAVAAPAIKEAQKRTKFRPATSRGSAEEGAAAIAQQVTTDQGLKEKGWFVNRVFVKATPADARWVDLINGDYEGASVVDVSKLQQLAFTILLSVTYGLAIWEIMAKQPFTTFPPVDPSLVALLGISHATYLADKQIGNT